MSTTAERYTTRAAATATATVTLDLMLALRNATTLRANYWQLFLTTPAGPTESRRAELIERLTERSLSDDGFDWDALAHADRDGWGIIES